MRTPIPYGRQSIEQDDIDAVIAVLQSDFLTQGPAVLQFEKEFSAYVDAKHAIAVANGTAALHLAALALGVNANSVVITTPITFAASANCILYCEGKVEFCDIDPATGLMDLDSLELMLSRKPRNFYAGIVAVDFAGYPINMQRLRKIADQYGLWVIEDACHAPGAYFTDSNKQIQRAGNAAFADACIFSFHPVKHIATGEGGMVTTNNDLLNEKIRMLRTHGITKDPSKMFANDGGWYYEMQELGFNYRMPDILCALGTSQLKKAEQGLNARMKIAAKYDAALKDHPLVKRLNSDCSKELLAKGIRHAFHLYVIRVGQGKRKALYDYLHANKVFAQVHYIPVHQLPYYKGLGWKAGDFPNAETYYNECLSIPMYHSLTGEQLEFVIDLILKFKG